VPQGPGQVPRFVVCPVCHLRNDVTARFCRDCGLPLGAPRDPVRGTTTRRTELPSERGAGIAAIVSLAAIVVIAGVAGYLALRGFETVATGAGANATGTPSGGPASTSPAATRGLDPSPTPTNGVDIGPTGLIDEPSLDPGSTDAHSAQPSEAPAATSVPTRTGWTCDPATVQDPLAGRWRIAQARWGRMDTFDRLTFDLTRLKGSAKRGATVRMAFLKPARAASRYGVATPAGDRALVLTFDGPLSLRAEMSAQPGLRALASLEARTDDQGVVHAVVGVIGSGCARIVATDWRDGSDQTTTAKLVIDVQR
jgi:hypothetical protein